MKMGFIGVGAMAKAMIRGFVNSNQVKAEDIYVHAPNIEKYKQFADELGINCSNNNQEVVRSSELIILAVRPNQVVDVLREVRDNLAHKTLASIAWQVTLERLEELTSYDLPVIRLIPNVNVEVNEGMLIYKSNENLIGESLKSIVDVFDLIGKTIEVEEDKFDVSGSLMGCTPAYAYLFADIFSRSAVNHGLDKQAATEMVAQAILGSMKMINQSEKSPNDLIDDVCSPAGGTIKGLLALKKSGFEKAVIDCFDATQEE